MMGAGYCRAKSPTPSASKYPTCGGGWMPELFVPPERPLIRLRIVEAKRHQADIPLRAFHIALFEISAAAPKRAKDRGAVSWYYEDANQTRHAAELLSAQLETAINGP
jgi:hypothetical protein